MKTDTTWFGRTHQALRERAIRWILRRQRPEGRQLTLNRRCIYILPTRQGYTFAMVLVVMLLGAINYSNSMAFMLTFLLAALGANAMWHTHRNLLGLRITRQPATPIFAGQSAQFTYTVDNPSRVSRRGLLLEAPGQSPTEFAVNARESTPVTLNLTARRRGVLRPGRLRLHTRYPLGLFRTWSWLNFDESVLVYPQPIPVERPLSGEGEDIEPQTTHNRAGEEFTGVRAYAPGDSPRRLDWKALARTGDMYTKEFHEMQGGQTWLDWEGLPAADVETRLSMLCHLVLEAHRKKLRFGLRMPGVEIEPATGELHRQRCLEQLACFALPMGETP
ncbi:DUF58 domain-containing protein [Ectothiorhodospira marina]|uniref:Uncharacterized conserved protein, DUF58 family, contains vWF domain n=1 Tax=Ectothiorhodospira marina TaxID=1396821 RepID=A0A1H7FSF9_9GAMM|nr:DUF58 domain-containing protein [Ectothiorhodospira marina]SEK27442.1 Uncharacterized conserved protein, DUF58 family, contains vWF domain [Ectothiorhodospira marina]